VRRLREAWADELPADGAETDVIANAIADVIADVIADDSDASLQVQFLTMVPQRPLAAPTRDPLPPCPPASLPPCPPFPPFLADPLPPCPPALLSSPAPCPPAPYQARLGREEGGLGHCSGNGLGKGWPERALKKKARACSAAMLPHPCASVQVVRCPPGYQSATIFMETSSSLRALALVPSLEDVVFRVRSRHRDGFI
jgi:hypothetical protein